MRHYTATSQTLGVKIPLQQRRPAWKIDLKTASSMNSFEAAYTKLSRPLSFRLNDTLEDKDEKTVPLHHPSGDSDAPSAGRGGPEGQFRYRAIWISDIHLGTRGCKAEYLIDFLRQTESDYLYLVGDIIDGWRLKKSWYWNQGQNDVIQKILRKARKGTEVVYVPGNHDEALRNYTSMYFGGVAVEREVIHLTADGRRLLVLHGDEFDGVVTYARWLAFLGDRAYNVALSANHWLNLVRRRLRLPYWSLSAYLKYKVKNAVQFVGRFESVVAAEACRRNIDGILYCNDGDWVESCTALVEHQDGRLEIIRFAEIDHRGAALGSREAAR
jgi:UDP-2,3-diacylglucosamine pyrophosphatase LpxH